MTLVIGGPKHGELVNWPARYPGDYYMVAVVGYHPLTDANVTQKYYRYEQILFFDFKCDLWVYEDISLSLDRDSEKFLKLLIPEILSLKGAHMLESSTFELKLSK